MKARCTPSSDRSTPALSARRRIAQRLDHLVGALVALAALADAAVDDLLQVIAAARGRESRRRASRTRASPLISMPSSWPDLVDIVARLPLRHRAREDVARRGQRVHRARGDAAPVALLADDAEVAELQAAAVADEHVQRREVAVQQSARGAACRAPRGCRRSRGAPPSPASPCRRACRNALRSPCARTRARGSRATRPSARISGKASKTRIARGCPSSSWPKYASRSQPSMRALTLMQTTWRNDRRAAEPPREIDLAEPALAEQPLDPVHAAAFPGCRRPRPAPADCRRAPGGSRTRVTLRVVAAVAFFDTTH